MRLTAVGVVLALTVMAGGCDSDDNERATNTERQSESPPASTAPTTPNVGALMEDLRLDALAIDPRAELVDPDSGTTDFFDSLMYLDSEVAVPGAIAVPSTFTVRYPDFNGPAHVGDFLRVFKKHGFGTTYSYTPDDIADGQVQKSGDLRCRVVLQPNTAFFQCTDFDFIDFVEYDVADEVTSLYVDETEDMDINCWNLIHPNAAGSDPPLGAILETGTCDRASSTRAYVDVGDGWELVATTEGVAARSPEFVNALCAPDVQAAFAPMDVCR